MHCPRKWVDAEYLLRTTPLAVKLIVVLGLTSVIYGLLWIGGRLESAYPTEFMPHVVLRTVLQEPEIPRKIHFVKYNDDSNEVWDVVQEKWRKLYPEPEYEHKYWNPSSPEAQECWDQYFPDFAPVYKNMTVDILKADSLRYCLLYAYGGIYTDLDYEPLINFMDELPPGKVSFVESPYFNNERIQNSLIASPEGHPFWLKVIPDMKERFTRFNSSTDDKVLWLTGPIMLTENVYKPGWQTIKEPTVHVLPCERFQRSKFNDNEVCGPVVPVTSAQAGIHWGTMKYMQIGLFHNNDVWSSARPQIDSKSVPSSSKSVFVRSFLF